MVSLKRRPKEPLVVHRVARIKNSSAGYEYVGTGEKETFPVHAFPLASREADDLGLQADTTVKVFSIGARLHVGVHDVVEFRGRRWETVGEVQQFRMTGRTNHDRLVLKALDAEVDAGGEGLQERGDHGGQDRQRLVRARRCRKQD
jgi:hypothetical protein